MLEIMREKKLLTEPQIKDLLDPVKLANLDKCHVSQGEALTIQARLHISEGILP